MFPSLITTLQKEDTHFLDQSLLGSLHNLDARIIIRSLDTIQQTCDSCPEQILERENFTYMYYALSYLELNLSRADRRESCEQILHFFSTFITHSITYCLQRQVGDEATLKQLLFLFFYCISSCAGGHRPTKCVMLDSKIKQQKDNTKLQTYITHFHKKSIAIMRECRHVQMTHDASEPSLTRYCTESLFKLLENKVLIKETLIKEEIYDLLLCYIEMDPQSLVFVQSRVINLIYEDDNIIQQLADILVKIYQSESVELRCVTIGIVSMVADNALNNTQSGEQQAIKNVCKFLQLLCNHLPKLFHQNLSVFIQFYNSENYLLRNAVTNIISGVLLKYLNPQLLKDLDLEVLESLDSQRINLQMLLFQRVHDKNAFSRSCVLNNIKLQCDANLIPAHILVMHFGMVCGRIRDQSSLVRRSTLKLVKSVMKYFLKIYVKEGDKVFLSTTQIQHQINLYKVEWDDAQTGLQEINDEMMNCQTETRFETLEQEQTSLKCETHKHNKITEILLSYLGVITHIKELIPHMILLMGSRSITDVKKAVSLFTFMHRYAVEGSDVGMKSMLVLVWHNEKSVVEHLLAKYYKLYLDYNELGVEKVIHNLTQLVGMSDHKERISLEQMLLQYFRCPLKMQDKLLELIWDKFLLAFRQNDLSAAIVLAFLVRIMFVARPGLLDYTRTEVLAQILNHYKKYPINWEITIKVAQIMGRVGQATVVKDFFKHLTYLLWQNFGSEDPLWFQACQEIMRLTSHLSSPEIFYKYILVKMTRRLLSCGSKSTSKQVQPNIPEECNFLHSESKAPTQVSPEKTHMQTSQLLFTIGEMALKILIHIYDIESQLKHLKSEAERKFENNMDQVAESELTKIQGGFEAEFEYNNTKLQDIAEQYTIYGEFLLAYHPFIMDTMAPLLCGTPDSSRNSSQLMAVLTYCKFMCLSERYCRDNIKTLFQLLSAVGVDPIIKNNIMVTLGDLLHRWPNTVTQYSTELFSNLSDSDYTVKRTTLNVLTHLVLNDMLKVKHEISDIGVLLSDKDPSITQLVKVFFTELHKKDNKLIYNILPEAIFKMSQLNQPFHAFIQFTAQYIDKDKSVESLVDKLSRRMHDDITIQEVRNLAYALTHFHIKEPGFRRLLENFSCWELRLGDNYVRQQFLLVGKKFCKRSQTSQESKQLTLEFDDLMQFGNERRAPRRMRASGTPRSSGVSNKTQFIIDE